MEQTVNLERYTPSVYLGMALTDFTSSQVGLGVRNFIQNLLDNMTPLRVVIVTLSYGFKYPKVHLGIPKTVILRFCIRFLLFSCMNVPSNQQFTLTPSLSSVLQIKMELSLHAGCSRAHKRPKAKTKGGGEDEHGKKRRRRSLFS